MVDRGQSKWCAAMASASALSSLCAGPQHVLVCDGEGLKDYFFRLVVNEERTAGNVLSAELTLAEAELVFGQTLISVSGKIAVGLSSLAMGDTCAGEYAQASRHGLFAPARGCCN